MASEKCQPGCTCGRHNPRVKSEKRKKCEPGCQCGRHFDRGHRCPEGCQCSRHKILPCEDGCQCYRHNGNTYDATSYSANHARVKRERGKAVDQDCVNCGGPATEWSYTHDSDPSDPQNYNPRCNKCHREYDEISQRMTGRTVSKETRAKISALRKGTTVPQDVRDAISNKLKGREFSDEHRAKISEGVKRFHERRHDT